LSIRTIWPAHCNLCNLMYFTFYCYGINAKHTHRRRVSVVVTVTMITSWNSRLLFVNPVGHNLHRSSIPNRSIIQANRVLSSQR
jgi:hypothetical protein